ncbi:MAG: CHAT domain-containing protein [Nibricoccus sp.]
MSTVRPPFDLERQVSAAEALAAAGRWEDALQAYASVVAGRLNAGTAERWRPTAADAAILERTAELAVLADRGEVGMKIFVALTLSLRAVGNRFAADLSILKRLHLAISAGNQAEIMSALEDLQPTVGDFGDISFATDEVEVFERGVLWEEVDDEDRSQFFAQFHLQAGRLFAWLGQFGDAAKALQRCVQHAATIPSLEPFALAARLEQVAVALACGDLWEARKQLATVAPEQEGQPGHASRRYELEATLFWLHGDLGGAERVLQAARAWCVRVGLDAARVMAELNLAHVLVVLNRTYDAEQLVVGAEKSAGGLRSPVLARRARQLASLIKARRESGFSGLPIVAGNAELWASASRAAPALDAVDGPAENENRAGGIVERLTDRTLAFYQLLECQQFDAAALWLEEARLVYGWSDSPLIALRIAALQGMWHYYRGDWIEAVRLLDEVIAQCTARELRHDGWQAVRVRLWCEERMGGDPIRVRALRTEEERLVGAMAASLAPEHRVLFELNKWSEDEARLGLRVAELQKECAATGAFSSVRRRLARWRWRGKVDRFVESLDARRTSLLGAACPNVLNTPWWWRSLRHSRTRATLSFLALPDRLLIVRESFLDLELVVRPVTRLRLRELVRAWHEAMAQGESGSSNARACAETMAEHLQLPALLEPCAHVNEVRVVADDVLHGFPFSALCHAGRLLIEDYAIVYDTTHRPSTAQKSARAAGFALVADMGLATPGYDALPGAAVEAQNVAAEFVAQGIEVKRLHDLEVTPVAIRLALSKARLAHIACHGVFARDSLRGTGLILAPGLPEGLLALDEFAGLALGGLRHVTLASCWSADNFLLPGRHVINLPGALLHAGAGSVLASLWGVPDATSADFYGAFYARCAVIPPAEALRETQLRFHRRELRPGNCDASDPFFWAGFTLTGSSAGFLLR